MFVNREVKLKISPDNLHEYAKPGCNICYGRGTKGKINDKHVLCKCIKKKLKDNPELWH
jgi:hypothetical protein